MFKLKEFILLIIVLINANILFAENGKSKLEVIIIVDTNIVRSEKEAILILPGLGDGKKQRKSQANYFSGSGYDLFIPDFIEKESYDATLEKFNEFHKAEKLGEYKELHVFCYILGSWTINTFIIENGIQNIKSIVYDRSPIQERAPIIIVENIPIIAKMMFGQLPNDISKIPYPTIDTQKVNIGIIVESKATKIMRYFKKKTIAKGEYNWGEINYHQKHDDLMYTHLDHKEMYLDLDFFGEDVLFFFENGLFGTHVQRKWYGWDSFKKLPKIKKDISKYKVDFEGKWESLRFYNYQLKDTVINRIDFNSKKSKIEYNILVNNSSESIITLENGNAKIDRKGTVLQFYYYGEIFSINQKPVKEADGRISIILNNVKYYKKNN